MSTAVVGSSAIQEDLSPATWLAETLYQDWSQSFRITGVVAREKSDYQDICIADTVSHGRVMLLDGAVQITEADEFVYQEMIVHVPLIQHGAAKSVLIIGAGDGGVLRRVLLHRSVQRVTMVEIDPAVVRLAKMHLPDVGGEAWDDSRARVVIGDGINYVAQATARSVDVIIVDSTDPNGPGEALFTEQFYQDCARILAPGGLLVNQCGVPFMQPVELTMTVRKLRATFAAVTAFVVAVPTYVGGFMALGIAGDASASSLTIEDIERRATSSGILGSTRYWCPPIHLASFALPPFIADLVGTNSNDHIKS